MRKITLFIIFSLLILPVAYPQWAEFNYFVLRLGLTNQFLNPSPSSSNGLFINSYEGDRLLLPDSNEYIKYNGGFDIGLDFHFDWHNDMGGFIIGAEYYNFAISNKFVSANSDDHIIRTMRMNSLSFPIFIKFGHEIFDLQRYAFVGARVNWNFQLDITEEASWNSEPRTQSYTNNIFNKFSYVIIGGINFLFLNIEADFFPQTFLNKKYQINVGTNKRPYFIHPFHSYPNTYVIITSSLYIPLSPWTGTRNYFLNRLIKNF